MSNELTTPKILVCPADKEKVPATSFGAGFSDTNSSYFVSLDASETYPQTFLTGDRNLAVAGKAAQPGTLVLTTNPPSECPTRMYGPFSPESLSANSNSYASCLNVNG